MPYEPKHDLLSPVEKLSPADTTNGPQPGIALCLSGGGYRAMLFHVGALIRLNELGYLAKLDRISSVSGGSITAGVLGLNWSNLTFSNGVATNLNEMLVLPIGRMASKTIDASSIIGGIFMPGSISQKIEAAYNEVLFRNATLQDLPDRPRFVINATNVQSLVLWRFSKPYMRDYRVGEVKAPRVLLAAAVAASSAFPPALSPAVMHADPSSFTPDSGTDLQREPYTSEVVLTDGGVYDNLGLETAWKRYQTVLVSDGGGATVPEPEPKHDWPRHAYRILNIIDNQVRSLRKRQVVESFRQKQRLGTYWGIRTNIADYELGDALPFPHERSMALANIATRLKAIDEESQQQLINWGYGVCDAAMRRHVTQGTQASPPSFPYRVGSATIMHA